jgi:pyridoxal phosphate enzyme (YggS family)
VAVSKTVELARIRAALAAGVREIGENYLQEAAPKFAELQDHGFIRHFIGHLQRNKAGRATDCFDVIQSIDREAIALAIGRRALERGRTIQALVEVNIAGEASKSGIAPAQALALAGEVARISSISLVGFMGMGPLGATESETRRAFRSLARLYEQLPAPYRQVLSMGMTGDYEIAIEEGSNMVRIGTGIFGLRSTHV